MHTPRKITLRRENDWSFVRGVPGLVPCGGRDRILGTFERELGVANVDGDAPAMASLFQVCFRLPRNKERRTVWRAISGETLVELAAMLALLNCWAPPAVQPNTRSKTSCFCQGDEVPVLVSGAVGRPSMYLTEQLLALNQLRS